MPYHGRVLHSFFQATVDRWPDTIAIDVPPGPGHAARQQVTYRELDQLAARLADRLGPATTGERIVATLLPRTLPWAYAAQLAALRTGAAYTCIDTAQPDERLRAILEDSKAAVLVTDGPGVARRRARGAWAGTLVDVTRDPPPAVTAVDGTSRRRVATHPAVPAASLAYLVYTSGTTGGPKGVMIEHRGVANLVASDLAEFGLRPGQRVGQSSSHTYDSSVEEIWLAFASGATLVVIDDEALRSGPDLVDWLRRERVNVLCPPPTLLRAMGCADPQRALPDLSLLYVGGEALPQDLADAWARGRRMVNGYGPTESSITALRGPVVPGRPVTIGRPVPGVQAWTVDPDTLVEQAGDVPGELCLGGAGLARGYWAQPDLTSAKFVDHPRLGRVYRTGDLVRRGPAGDFVYLGRIDSQVKIRGHRVELGEIESQIVEHDGVLAAVCRLQEEGNRQLLEAFVVPVDPGAPPPLDEVAAHVKRTLPAHMVPARYSVIDTLPTNLAGKLDRTLLPRLDLASHSPASPVEPPGGDMEALVATTMREVLGLARAPGLHDDFFTDLGGESLAAARLVTALRDDRRANSLAVRDVYESPTVAGLAALARVRQAASAESPRGRSVAGDEGHVTSEDRPARRPANSGVAAIAQFAWLLAGCAVGGTLGFLALTTVLLPMVERLGLVRFTLLVPFVAAAGLSLYVPLALAVAVAAKRILVGTYREGRWPVWQSFYLRHWVVLRTLRLVPWRLIEGTAFQVVALRALGARIGRRVHIHRGVDLLHGGWDLLDLGDEVTISQDAALHLSHLEDGELVLGRVTLGTGTTLEVHASVGPGSRLDAGAYLTAWSWLPPGSHVGEGERWEGIPARLAGRAPDAPPVRGGTPLSPGAYAVAWASARWIVAACVAAALAAAVATVMHVTGIDERALLASLRSSDWQTAPLVTLSALAVAVVPLWLVLLALLVRAISPSPDRVIGRWSLEYVRVWLAAGMLRAAGEWLSGAVFWPHWLRLAGMRVGRGCEISTIIDLVASHVSIGDESFFADGIYLGSPRVHRGTVTLAATHVGAGTFLGNHVIVPAGQRLPEDILLGVCTVADDAVVRPGSAWFGHPPFELPRRERIEEDRRLTHEPSLVRYVNRWLWETARVALPVVPVCVAVAWLKVLTAAWASPRVGPVLFATVVVPLASLVAAATLCAIVLALKWLLLGRVRPGRHALWSCWCSRWDFLYMAWGFWAHRVLAALEGTPMLPWYVRAMGAKVGSGTVLGSGFAQVVDPDMLHIEDGATVDCLFQAHTFEDRVLKIDRVFIRRDATVSTGSVVLYGAEVGESAHVASHSVVMKRERLLPGRSYVGCPTRVYEGA
jgi:non-ribosomal peptide synthetase-like protein